MPQTFHFLTYTWASENGYCILMGSYWNCEFSLFYYGQNTRTSAEISRLCKSFYAWKLPSDFSLAASDCYCGSCLLREEFSKDALPEWIDWQQKKDIVLAFASSIKILLSNCLSQRILNVPDQPQLPPFTFQNPTHCSNKWPRKMQHCNALVGPAVPLHFLVTYNKLYIEAEADGQSANCL